MLDFVRSVIGQAAFDELVMSVHTLSGPGAWKETFSFLLRCGKKSWCHGGCLSPEAADPVEGEALGLKIDKALCFWNERIPGNGRH